MGNKKGRSLFFMGKWRQGIALFLTGILIMTSIFTWNSPIRVHAKEAVIKSSADGFEYRLRTYASGSTDYICTSDATQVYDNYKDAIKGIAEITKKIVIERKLDKYSISIPVEIKADQRVSDIDGDNGANPFMNAYKKRHIRKQGIRMKDRD